MHLKKDAFFIIVYILSRMQQPRKRHYRKKIRDSFAYIRAHIWYQKLISLPFGMRVFFAVLLFLI